MDYPTKSDLRKHLQTAVKNLNAGADKPVPQAPTMGMLIKKYKDEYLSGLAKSTRNTDGSMLVRLPTVSFR